MMDRFSQKVMYFLTALKDVYRDDDSRELFNIPKLELSNDTILEDMTAMFYAMFTFYKIIKDEQDEDIVDFIGFCNRLAIERIIRDEKKDWEKNEHGNG